MPLQPINWLNILTKRGGPSGPVQLTIAFVATQFVFKWKAPSGSTLTFNWGDGTTSDVSGNDSTLVTTTSSYAGAGTYSFWITGDVGDLTYEDFSAQAFVSGSWTSHSQLTNLTHFDPSSTGTTGNVEGFASVSGLTVLNVDDTGATGDGSLLAALSFTSFLFNSTFVTWGSNATMSLTSATVNAASSGMSTSTQVDNFIDSTKGSTGSTMNVAGTNAHRTAASNDDLNTLYANGNTITLNDTLSAELNTTASAVSDPNGNEADSVGDFTQVGLDAGANVFQSQGVTVDTGSFALEADANDTPTAFARFLLDLEAAPISIIDNDVVRIEFRSRHIGSGGIWRSYLASGGTGTSNLLISLASTDTTFQTVVYYWTHDDFHRYFTFREFSVSNDGGVYADNLSVRKVTFV